ncbi:hypothetical protein AALC25_05865 [Lachnospiraceae bacterium 29-84]
MEEQGMIVEGFAFASQEAASLAQREAESIQYVKSQMNMKSPRMALEVYRKLTQEEVFETPVGIAFLKELRDYLLAQPEIQEELAPVQTQKMGAVLAGRQAGEMEMASLYDDKLRQAKERVRSMEQKKKQAEQNLNKKKNSLRFSLFFNLFLILVVVGMVSITLVDDNPNILNYEEKILDKYSAWESELDEREQDLKKREQSLKESGQNP